MLHQYITWSPSADQIAVTFSKQGVWLLDLATLKAEDVISETPQWWLRPVWNEAGDHLFLSIYRRAWWMRRTQDGWHEAKSITLPGWIRWVEWMTPAGCVGICLPDYGSPFVIHIDQELNSMQQITPRLPSGSPLRLLGSEYPSWWEPGESVLVTGYGKDAIQSYIVYLKTNEAELLDWKVEGQSGYFHCYSRAFLVPVVAGFRCQDPFLLSENAQEDGIAYHLELRRLWSWGAVPQNNRHLPMALSPKGERIALIDREFDLHIIPIS